MGYVDVMIWAFLGGLVWLATGWVCYACGRNVERQQQEEQRAIAAAHEEASREHRTRMLRERGRIHDVREDATGEPAVTRPITVLGKSPRYKPPTRM